MGSHFVIKKELMLNTYFYFTLSPEKFHQGLVLQTFLVWTPCFIKDFSEIYKSSSLMIQSSSSPTCRHSTGRAGPGWQCRGETHCPCTGSFHSAGSACGTGLKLQVIPNFISDKWQALFQTSDIIWDTYLLLLGWERAGGRWLLPGPSPPGSQTQGCRQSQPRPAAPSPGQEPRRSAQGCPAAPGSRQRGNQAILFWTSFIVHWNVKEIVRINISSRPVLHCNHHKVLSHQLSSSKLRSSTWSDRHCITSALLFFIISDNVENFDQTISAWLFRQKLKTLVFSLFQII